MSRYINCKRKWGHVSKKGKLLFKVIRIFSLHYLNILVDCEWDVWVIGECSKTCSNGNELENGVQIDTRGKKQEALFGGEECEGEATRQGECNTDPCPSKKLF